MKILSLTLLFFLEMFQLSLMNESSTKHFRTKSKIEIDPIDSIYRQLIADKANGILLYNELFWGGRSKGVIAWKKLDSLYGFVFESDSAAIIYKKEIVVCRKQLEEAVSLYFANEKQIADTLPENPIGVSHDFEVNIRSYDTHKQRDHRLHASQVIYFRNPFIIGKVANLLNDIIYFEQEADSNNIRVNYKDKN